MSVHFHEAKSDFVILQLHLVKCDVRGTIINHLLLT